MARDTSPQCKQCRREGDKLYLKGERCITDRCAMERRSYPPGEHGRGRRRRDSEYLLQLRQKQRARRYYGLMERQFRNYYKKASMQQGVTGDNLLRLLEMRLDNVVYRLGFGASRRQARQIVRHGHMQVNGRRVNIPSYQVSPDEIIIASVGKAVSYTHLRAHETKANLVCRLLLEKKKKPKTHNNTPKQPINYKKNKEKKNI